MALGGRLPGGAVSLCGYGARATRGSKEYLGSQEYIEERVSGGGPGGLRRPFRHAGDGVLENASVAKKLLFFQLFDLI